MLRIDLRPQWCRHRGTPKDLRQAQEVSAEATAHQVFPSFFMLNHQASSTHRRVELRVAVKVDGFGMEQRILQIDVNASKFSVLTYPTRNIVETFEISHLVQADYPGDLVIRLTFRHSVPGWISQQLNKKNPRKPMWTRVFHTMSANQRDYIGALLQGIVGVSRPLNVRNTLLCSPSMLKIGREKLSLWVGSWNMSGKAPPDFSPTRRGVTPSIRPWLLLDSKDYDLYVAGMQEMDPTVFSMIEQQLGPDFYQVAKCSLGLIGLGIYIRKRLLSNVKNVETVTSATGFAGVGTNKGYCAAALSYMEQPLLFINCHMAARDDAARLRQRVHQFKLASTKLRMGKLPGTDVYHQFNVWFFGDMNFRVCVTDRDAWPLSNRTRRDVLDLLYGPREGKTFLSAIEKIRMGDQLAIEKKRKTIFDGFVEAPITFSPTYKYESFPRTCQWESVKDGQGRIVGHQSRDMPQSEYSRAMADEDLGADLARERVSGYYLSARPDGQRREYTEHKHQAPSWCDRILYRTLPPIRVDQNYYGCCDDILTSDHSPVCATYTVDVPRTSSGVPSASFHVGAVQILRIEVFNFRHPAATIQSFYDEDPLPPSRSKTRDTTATTTTNNNNTNTNNNNAGGGIDLEDDDEDAPPTPQHHHPTLNPTLSLLAINNNLSSPRRMHSDGSDASELDYNKDEEDTKELHFKQLCIAAVMPFMKDASTRTRVTSKPGTALTETHTWAPDCVPNADNPEYIFAGTELEGVAIGPFLTTREHLSGQWFVLHLLPKHTSETKESVGCCVVSLEEAAPGKTVNFEAELQHNGQPSGFIRGKFRVWLDDEGWDSDYVANPRLHPLNPKNLARSALREQQQRRKSPAPPGWNKPPLHPIRMWFQNTPQGTSQLVLEKEYVGRDTMLSPDHDDGNDEDGNPGPEDEFARLAKSNTIFNASAAVNTYQKRMEEKPVQVDVQEPPARKSKGRRISALVFGIGGGAGGSTSPTMNNNVGSGG
jgi:hypothetical protein